MGLLPFWGAVLAGEYIFLVSTPHRVITEVHEEMFPTVCQFLLPVVGIRSYLRGYLLWQRAWLDTGICPPLFPLNTNIISDGKTVCYGCMCMGLLHHTHSWWSLPNQWGLHYSRPTGGLNLVLFQTKHLEINLIRDTKNFWIFTLTMIQQVQRISDTHS